MKYTGFGMVLLFFACSTAPSGVVETDPNELVLGSWEVNSASIDGNNYAITSPGFGQIEAIFEDKLFTYIYPEVGSNGLPNGKTDTLFAIWEFNAAFDTLRFRNPQSGVTIFEWQVKQLQVGKLSTSYAGEAAQDPSQFSRYNIDYKLK